MICRFTEIGYYNMAFLNDWHWQIKNSVKTVDGLRQLLPQSSKLASWVEDNFASSSLPFSVTPYFISLMNGDVNCPIFSQVISSNQELIADVTEMPDPLGEEQRQHVPHLVHRYPDRVLFLATDRCASYCRFCTRKRWVGQGPSPMREEQEEAFNYIEKNCEIKEIIFSGGDPLLLSNKRIRSLIARAFSIKHIDMVRFHSRILSFAPMRIDEELSKLLQEFSPIYLVTHFNHAREITEWTIHAIELLQKSGIVLLNQSVLLKGVNDDEKVLQDLFRTLVKNKIRPYYLHQCDLITGTKHFRVPIARSIELMEKLRGHISGLCLPTLVVDIPQGHGKVPLSASPIVKEDEQFIYLRGFAGEIAAYPKE
jgi:lysine 2,3-aminomutase